MNDSEDARIEAFLESNGCIYAHEFVYAILGKSAKEVRSPEMSSLTEIYQLMLDRNILYDDGNGEGILLIGLVKGKKDEFHALIDVVFKL